MYSAKYYEILDKRKNLSMWKQFHDFLDMLEKYQTLILVRETSNSKTT